LTTGPEAPETALRLGRKRLCGGAYGGVANGILITQDPLTGGPDDPSIAYKNNLFSFVNRAIEEYFSSMQPSKLNRYVYCQNNPINMIDPLGLQEEEAGTIKELDDGEIEEDETSTGSKTEREKEKTKAEIDRSDLSDREKRELKDRIDDMSVGEFKEWQRAQERAADKAERHADYKVQLGGYGNLQKPNLAASLLGSLGVAVLDGPAPAADIVALGLAAGALYQAYHGSQQATPQWLKDTWTSPNNQDMNGGPPWNFRDIPTWMKVVGVSSAVTYLAVEWYWKIRGQDIEEASVAPQQGSKVNRISTASPPEIKSITHYEPEIKCEYIYAPELKNRSSY